MPDNIKSFVGTKIRYYRKARGYNLIEFADKIHRSKSSLSKYERGEVSIDIETLNDISNALDVPLSLLVDHEAPSMNHLFSHHQSDEKKQIYYLYLYAGHKKAYVTRSVLFVGETTAIAYAEVENEQNYQKCKYQYVGQVQRGNSFIRLFLENPVHNHDICVIDFPKPLNTQSILFGFFVTLSIGVNFPVATKCAISTLPITEDSQIIEMLKFAKADMNSFKKHNGFFVIPEFSTM